MSMKRTPEWYAAYAKRQQEWKTAAGEWNGNIEPINGLNKVDRESAKPVPLYPLVTLCRSMRIAEPVPEYRFHPTRKWRADYCWPTHMLMLEVNGGVWTQGRHTRGQGAIDDMEKASEAAIMGYRVLYCTPEQMHNGVALDRIIRALTDRAAA